MIKEIDGVFPGVVENGSLNRKKLGEIVFNDKSKLLALNKVTHKYICGEIDRIIEKEKRRNSKYLAIDAIELIESGVSQLCDIVIAVTAPIKMRIARIMAREGISMAYAAMRISAQKPDTYYNEHCDKVICNDFDDREKFKEFCINMFKNILED